MRQTAKKIISHPLIYGSGIVVIGSVASNFFNFLFNLFMSRNLSVPDYGTLASILSLIAFPALIAGAINPLVVSFAGAYFAKSQFGMIRDLYGKIFKFLLILGLLIFLTFLMSVSSIGEFFHIEDKNVLIITSFIIFLAFVGIINIALIQAKLAFKFQIFLNLLGSTSKLILGILLVILGLSVNGSVLAILISALMVYIVSFFPIRFIFDRKLVSNSALDKKELFAYGIPSAITLFGLTSLISTDVILVKHFFDPHNAGIYAGMSLIGRVIFYISYPIGSVMFPIVVKKQSNNENFDNTFKLSLLIVSLPSIILTVFYFIFPKFSILFFLKKDEYLAAQGNLGFFGIFITLYCMLFIISNFYLSIKKTKVYIPIALGSILQIIFIYFFHNSFQQIITISSIITFLLVVSLLLYYPHVKKIRS